MYAMVKSVLVPSLLRICWFMTFVCFFTAGCKEDPYVITCKDGRVEYEELKDGEIVYFVNVKEDAKFIQRVIQSQSELEQSINLSNVHIKVDFREKTLLAGRVYSSQRANLVRQEVISDCKDENITYTITLKYHEYLPESGYTKFFAVIPKISDKTKVQVIINYEN